MPTDTDPETSSAEPLVETLEGTHEAILHKSDQSPFSQNNASPSVGVHSDIQTTGDIVSQLLAKVNELQEANSHISAHKDALNDRLAAASSQFDEMRRKYEFLEERVIEAEIRNHRILELEDGEPITEDALMAIEWRQDDNGALMLEVSPLVLCRGMLS
jgi:predicted RNase H-like nuclease (RuvC/YqgF family)